MRDDSGNIKRAAIVLFGKNPAKFYNNCVVKIGRFSKDSSELSFQEVVEGHSFAERSAGTIKQEVFYKENFI